MINLDDLKLDASAANDPTVDVNQAEAIDAESELGTEDYEALTDIALEMLEPGDESLLGTIGDFLWNMGSYAKAAVNWIRGKKSFILVNMQVDKFDVKKRVILPSSVKIFYRNPRQGGKDKCLAVVTSIAHHEYKVNVPKQLNVIKGNKLGDMVYIEDLPKLVPDLMQDIKKAIDVPEEIEKDTQGRILYFPTFNFSGAIVKICQANGTELNYKKVDSHKDDMGQHHYGKESYTDFNRIYSYQHTSELIAGTEDYGVPSQPPKEMDGEAAMVMMRKQMVPPPIAIRCFNQHNYRVYLSSRFMMMPALVTQLCRFFDTRSSEDRVELILGSAICDEQSHAMGSLVSAITSCRATVKAIAAGCCSVSETILWCFAPERTILKYGALNFGKSDIVRYCPKLEVYFELFLKRAKEIGIISEEDATSIMKNNTTKMVMFEDIHAAQPSQ